MAVSDSRKVLAWRNSQGDTGGRAMVADQDITLQGKICEKGTSKKEGREPPRHKHSFFRDTRDGRAIG